MPKTSVIIPRFYVLQSDKCRPIDDFTFNLLNSAVGSANKVVLRDTDFIAALLKRCCGYAQVPWRGRAFDLQDAYRQLAIAPEHQAHSLICVYEPQHGPRCYRMLTMLFGSSASVYAFLRTSLAIHAHLAPAFFALFLRRFPGSGARAAHPRCHAPDSVPFHLAGFSSQWQAFQEPAFCSRVSGAWGCLQPHASPSRVFKVASLQELLTSHSLLPKEARKLRGRMQFAHGQLSGRNRSTCLSSLHELSALAPGSQAPSSLVKILERCLQSLVYSMPRAISSKDRLVWHVFTDGALEASKPSIGGVLVDFFGQPRFHFSFEPPAVSVLVTCGSHCIFQTCSQAPFVPSFACPATTIRPISLSSVSYALSNG